jgi:hypothetical protein
MSASGHDRNALSHALEERRASRCRCFEVHRATGAGEGCQGAVGGVLRVEWRGNEE